MPTMDLYTIPNEETTTITTKKKNAYKIKTTTWNKQSYRLWWSYANTLHDNFIRKKRKKCKQTWGAAITTNFNLCTRFYSWHFFFQFVVNLFRSSFFLSFLLSDSNTKLKWIASRHPHTLFLTTYSPYLIHNNYHFCSRKLHWLIWQNETTSISNKNYQIFCKLPPLFTFNWYKNCSICDKFPKILSDCNEWPRKMNVNGTVCENDVYMCVVLMRSEREKHTHQPNENLKKPNGEKDECFIFKIIKKNP